MIFLFKLFLYFFTSCHGTIHDTLIFSQHMNTFVHCILLLSNMELSCNVSLFTRQQKVEVQTNLKECLGSLLWHPVHVDNSHMLLHQWALAIKLLMKYFKNHICNPYSLLSEIPFGAFTFSNCSRDFCNVSFIYSLVILGTGNHAHHDTILNILEVVPETSFPPCKV